MAVPVKKEEVSPAAGNLAIMEYYKYALMGIISADTSSRLPEIVTRKAMEMAIAAYKTQVEVLGADLERAPD